MALNEFEGTVMLVSHDRALLREVCDEFWLVTAAASQPFDGDLDDYQRWLLEQSRAAARAARPERRAPKPPRGAPGAEPATAQPAPRRPRPSRATTARPRRPRASSAPTHAKPLRKELNQIDNRLGVLFAERDTLEAPLAADTRRRRASAPRPAGA